MSLSLFKLFNDASAAQLSELDARLPRFHKQRGDIFYIEGSDADTVYLLSSGLVRFEGANMQGKGFNYGIATPGNIFGELEATLITPYHASAIAMSETRGRIMTLPVFNELFTQQAWFSRNLCGHLARSARANQAMYRNVLTLSPPVRLAKTLLWLWKNHISSSSEILTLSQEELAHVLGMSRQSVNKYMKTWQDNDWISVGYGCIRVLDRESLACINDEHE